MFVLDAAGWLGGVAVVVAYVLVSMRRVGAEARTFQGLNIAGGVLLTVSSLYYGALPNTVFNIVWIAFGSYALLARRTPPTAGTESGGPHSSATSPALSEAQYTEVAP